MTSKKFYAVIEVEIEERGLVPMRCQTAGAILLTLLDEAHVPCHSMAVFDEQSAADARVTIEGLLSRGLEENANAPL